MSDEPGRGWLSPVPSLDELAERLLDAASTGRFEEDLALAERALESEADSLDRGEVLRYRVLFFDLALVSTTERRLQASTAIELLGMLDADSWGAVLLGGRIDDLRQLTEEPELGIELCELLTYAPEPGIRDYAVTELERIGLRLSIGGEETRSIERLLHAAGANGAAYRLEAGRKLRATHGLPMRAARLGQDRSLPYRVIAIAGGHAQLRSAASAVLQPYGVTVVAIPSSQEAVRRERGIVQSLQGCDLVVLLVRQLTHSTSDQVRKAAGRLGVPVFYSNAASAVAIERQLLELERSRTKE